MRERVSFLLHSERKSFFLLHSERKSFCGVRYRDSSLSYSLCTVRKREDTELRRSRVHMHGANPLSASQHRHERICTIQGPLTSLFRPCITLRERERETEKHPPNPSMCVTNWRALTHTERKNKTCVWPPQECAYSSRHLSPSSAPPPRSDGTQNSYSSTFVWPRMACKSVSLSSCKRIPPLLRPF